MLSLLFLLCISYSVMRNVKDTLILTIDGVGAEASPFLKVWGMLPGAVMATWGFTHLARRLSRRQLFFTLIGGYITYYLLFAFVLYPLNDSLTLTALSGWLSGLLPKGASGFVAMLSYWNLSFFYVITELWGSLVLAVLFWGMANDLSSVEEAKRTYGILNIGSNIAPVFGGYLVMLVGEPILARILGTSGWDLTIKQVSLLVALFLVGGLFLFQRLCRLYPEIAEQTIEGKAAGKRKNRMGVLSAAKTVLQDPYLLSLSLVVLGFNISINLADLAWKDQLQSLMKDRNEMSYHMGQITMLIGVIATCCAVTFAPLMQRLGWLRMAMITPVVMLSLGIVFFGCRFGLGNSLAPLLGLTPLALTVYAGSMQNALSKGCKYCIFDATKEMAFLPLDEERRARGKSAIDGLGSGLGKSGASLMTQGLIIVAGSLSAASPAIAVILGLVLITWMVAVRRLGRDFVQSQETSAETAGT
jgi:AAA family ATP:ADP antiporter